MQSKNAGATPDKIPHLSIVLHSELGVAVLHHCGGDSNNYQVKNSQGRVASLPADQWVEVIATPEDLAQRFLSEASDRLVLDPILDRARSVQAHQDKRRARRLSEWANTNDGWVGDDIEDCLQAVVNTRGGF